MLSEELTGLIDPNCKESAARCFALLEQMNGKLGITPFVGAGLSVDWGYLGWSEFLRGVARDYSCEEKIALLLKNSDFEEAAAEAENACGAGVFEDLITKTFGGALSKKFRCGAVRHLPNLFHGAVLTTNFDQVLEAVFLEHGRAFEKIVTRANLAHATDAFHTGRSYLFKIHGCVDDRANIILTRAQYSLHYGASHAVGDVPLRQLLEIAIDNRPILFLGCSLGNDRTMQILKECAKRNKHVKHYAILARPEDPIEWAKRKRFLGALNIYAIWYPPGAHANLGRLLEVFVKYKKAATPMVLPPEVPLCLSFKALFTPSLDSVTKLLTSDQVANVFIDWPDKINKVTERFEQWTNHFDEQVNLFPWADKPGWADTRSELAKTLARRFNLFDKARERLNDNLSLLLQHIHDAPPQYQTNALLSFAGLATLQILRHLVLFEEQICQSLGFNVGRYHVQGALASDDRTPPSEYSTVRLILSDIHARYLVPPYKQAPPAAGRALIHLPETLEEYLVCRIMDGEPSVDKSGHDRKVVLPRSVALNLLRKSSSPETKTKVYFERLLPMWLASLIEHSPPSPESFYVFVIEAEDGTDYRL